MSDVLARPGGDRFIELHMCYVSRWFRFQWRKRVHALYGGLVCVVARLVVLQSVPSRFLSAIDQRVDMLVVSDEFVRQRIVSRCVSVL